METAPASSLLDSARSGDADAYGELCRQFETRLLRQALTLCGNESAAEELAENTLVDGWKSLHRYNGQCQFFTWLCAILLNHYRNWLRHRRSRAFQSQLSEAEADGALEAISDPDSSPDDEAQRREQASVLIECIEALPRKHQEVIYLRFYIDDSLEGIAGALGCSVGTIKSRLFRALEKLRSATKFKEYFL